MHVGSRAKMTEQITQSTDRNPKKYNDKMQKKVIDCVA